MEGREGKQQGMGGDGGACAVRTDLAPGGMEAAGDGEKGSIIGLGGDGSRHGVQQCRGCGRLASCLQTQQRRGPPSSAITHHPLLPYLREPAHGLLPNRGVVLQRETVLTQFIRHLLHPRPRLHRDLQ